MPMPDFSSPTSNSKPSDVEGFSWSVSSVANTIAATLAFASTVPRPAMIRSSRLKSVEGAWREYSMNGGTVSMWLVNRTSGNLFSPT